MGSIDTREPHVSECLEPVAIIGMGCRWPGDSESPSELWDFLQERKTAYSRIPKNRINTDAFYNPNSGRPGSFYTEGGCFLKSDPRKFDHTFFGINPKEVMSMDPAQRKLLEVVYEAFESSGTPLHKLAGSSTGCFPYSVTGGGITALSNRVNYIFDLKGPSLTLDTACSSSMYALHLACSSIQTGECIAAVVGGSNLILTPECQVFSSNLGAVSKTSVCHTFDESADGYARADGVAALYVKKLSKAIEDGDPIRAVIRATAINANGRTGGITHPSPEGQEAVIRRAYERAGGLDPALTGYFECHGTGTAVGDPLEVSAIGRVFSSYKSKEVPLLIGSIKSNMGHSEPTSGLAGIMKVTLAIERGIIPPTVSLKTLNPNIDLRDGAIKIVTESTAWPDLPVRRASVNSFGYGGANAHAIIESVESIIPGYRSRMQADKASRVLVNGNGSLNVSVNGHGSMPRKFLLAFSAHDEETLSANIRALGTVADNWKLSDIAFTLSERRSILSHRAFVITDEIQVAEDLQTSTLTVIKKPASSTEKLGFVFTGQGAQWPQMGLDLMASFPSYLATIKRLDLYLDGLDDQRPWSLLDVLKSSDPKLAHIAEISQPLLTAIQVALVNVLREWDIMPTAVVGHSSGEIAAAYAAGLTTEREAMIAAYLRGKAVARNTKPGNMMAVDLTTSEAEEYIRSYEGRVVIACYNSPSSLTLSGDVDAITQLQEQLQAEKRFARVLKTNNNAYHSAHMKPLGSRYEYELSISRPSNPGRDTTFLKAAIRSRCCAFFSSVLGEEYHESAVEARYFRQNLESPVRFHQAVDSMVASTALDALVEIGPHSALQGPLRQIREKIVQRGGNFPEYLPTVVRNSNNTTNLLSLAGKLFSKGYPVSLDRVNAVEDPYTGTVEVGQTIVDLPHYQWCPPEEILLTENRWTREWRQRMHPRHDILGSRIPGGSKTEPVWRNVLRHKDLPWLKDHAVGKDTVFPSTGYFALALEAVTQAVELDGFKEGEIGSYEFHNISLHTALVIPEDDRGVEILLTMRLAPLNNAQRFETRYEFGLSSVIEEGEGYKFVEHCRGTVEVSFDMPSANHEQILVAEVDRNSRMKKLMNVAQCYKQFATVGLCYGPIFHGLSDVKGIQNTTLSEAIINLLPTAKLSLHESRYVIHPAALDAALQLTIVAAHHTDNMRLKKAFMPVSFDRIKVYPRTADGMTNCARTIAKADLVGVRGLSAQLAIVDNDQKPFIEITNALLISSDQSVIQAPNTKDSPYARMVWKPDFDTLDDQALADLYPPTPLADDAIIPSLNHLALHQLIDFKASNTHTFDQGSEIPQLQRLLDWITDKLQLAENDAVSPASEIMALTPKARKSRIQELEAKVCPLSSEARLMSHLYHNLPAIYAGEKTGIQVALQDNLLIDNYEVGQVYREGNKRLGQVLSLLGHKRCNLRILEVGAGTGSATREVLPALKGSTTWRQFTEYRFTDTTPSFLAAAEETFKAYDGLTYGVFDMEQPANTQGYEPDWDVVIASNVVHATSDIKNTLLNIRGVLKPGGKMMLLELTRSQLSAGLVLGTFSDFWKGDQDPEFPRLDGPFLSKSMWRNVLPQAGFSGVDFFLDDYAGENASATVVCTTAVEVLPDPLAQPQVTLKDCVTLVYRDPSSPFAQALIPHLESQGTGVHAVSLNDVPELVHRNFMFVAEAETPLFHQVSQAEWSGLQKCISFAHSVLWVTNGALLKGQEPLFAMVSGLARGLQTEMRQLRFHILDLDNESAETSDVLDLIIQHQERVARTLDADDTEFRRKDGLTYISRMEADERLNDNYKTQLSTKACPERTPLRELQTTPFRMDIEKPGVLSTLYFRPDAAFAVHLADDEVEIEVRAAGINNKDIAVVTGRHHSNTFSDECAGVITKVGQKVTNIKPGDHVYCHSFAKFGNFVRDKAIFCQKMRDGDSFEACATLPIAFCTVIYALLHLGNLRRGQSVLIQSATGAVGIAACQIAHIQGAEIYATVGTPEKKAALLAMGFGIAEDHIFDSRGRSTPEIILERTSGRGIDVIMCSARGEMMQEYWNCIAPSGRFIDIGRTEILGAGTLNMDVFRRNATFASFDLEVLSKGQPEIIGQLMAEIQELYEQGSIKPIEHTKYHLSEIDKALTTFAKGAHVGKFVVSYDLEVEAGIRYLRSPFMFAFDPDASYLLVGCLGGLGRSFIRWAVQQGARQLLCLSRSGAAGPEAQALIGELTACGVDVQIVQGDVEVLEDVEKAVRQSQYPIKGVVQGALSLHDGLFESMSLENFKATVGPRVTGTLNLHQALKNSPLDFFEIWSSWTTLFGTATQSNYLASNAFMDAFARHRQELGLPVCSLSLSQVLGIGIVSYIPEYQQSMIRNGFYGNHEDEFLSYCEAGLHPSSDSSPLDPTTAAHLLVGIEPAGLEEVNQEYPLNEMVWSRDARFSSLLQATHLLSTKGGAAKSSNGTLEDKERSLSESIQLKVSRLLYVPLDEVEVARPINAYGIDSMIAAELRNWLFTRYSFDVSLLNLLGPTMTIERLAGEVECASA
ncbi:hypothetical protein BDV06DRAFT_222783 [Aspergillus oleicola]